MTTTHETYTSATDYLTKRLRRELKELDEHEKETRRLLDHAQKTGVYLPAETYDSRSDTHRNLSARLTETARALAVVLP